MVLRSNLILVMDQLRPWLHRGEMREMIYIFDSST
jgi:hypothetical protein